MTHWAQEVTFWMRTSMKDRSKMMIAPHPRKNHCCPPSSTIREGFGHMDVSCGGQPNQAMAVV